MLQRKSGHSKAFSKRTFKVATCPECDKKTMSRTFNVLRKLGLSIPLLLQCSSCCWCATFHSSKVNVNSSINAKAVVVDLFEVYVRFVIAMREIGKSYTSLVDEKSNRNSAFPLLLSKRYYKNIDGIKCAHVLLILAVNIRLTK
nr:uncharacterized protein LOC124816829 [Hydra vulgaris]